MTYTVPVICAWCGVQYGTKDGFAIDLPTHGICLGCFEANMPKVRQENDLEERES